MDGGHAAGVCGWADIWPGVRWGVAAAVALAGGGGAADGLPGTSGFQLVWRSGAVGDAEDFDVDGAFLLKCDEVSLFVDLSMYDVGGGTGGAGGDGGGWEQVHGGGRVLWECAVLLLCDPLVSDRVEYDFGVLFGGVWHGADRDTG